MSLAVPTDLAARTDVADVLLQLLQSLPGPVTWHVHDGRQSGRRLPAEEFETAVRALLDCRFLYVLEGMLGRVEPIAAFAGAEALGRVQLRYLIDDRPPAAGNAYPPRTLETLGVHLHALFQAHAWIKAITIPGDIFALEGRFDLTVIPGDPSTVICFR